VVSADADLRIKLPVFEGPLDLLLFLIRKNELDIYDIPIATVTRQYIEVLRSMQQLDLEIAGEFFVMAASLMEIKSRMLLPRGQAAVGEGEDDDPLDPRWELVHQLLQYKKFKEAAAKLDELAAFQRDMLARHVVEVAATENERPLKPVDRIELWNAFNLVLRRLAEKLVVGEIKGEEVTVSDKMEELLELTRTRKKFLFTDLFEGKTVTVRLLVATFIAVLELTRLKKLRVRQDEAYADIHVEAVEDTVNADGTLAEGQLNFSPAAPDHTLPAAAAAASAPVPDDEPAPRPEQPPLVLTADGYATIPTVLGAAPAAEPTEPPQITDHAEHAAAAADDPAIPADAPEPIATLAPAEPAPEEGSPRFTDYSAGDSSVASAAASATEPVVPQPSDQPAETVASAAPSPDDPSPSVAAASAPTEPAADDVPRNDDLAPLAPETSPVDETPPEPSAPPSGDAPDPAEQKPAENPLDTQPPRNTLNP
jgi:segregation and condensation protein A